MKNTEQVRHFRLLIGTAMCGLGIVTLLSFPMPDFLSPGFVEKGIILESAEMKGDSSINGIMHVDEIGKKYILVLSDNNDYPTKFDTRIEGPDGFVSNTEIFEKGKIEVMSDMKGDYQINVKNLSGKPSSLSLSYGLPSDYDQVKFVMTSLGVLMFIGGNYLILHKQFTKIFN